MIGATLIVLAAAGLCSIAIWALWKRDKLDRQLRKTLNELTATGKLLDTAIVENEALKQEVRGLYQNMERSTKDARADAVKRSEAVIKGKVGENFCPFNEDFPYEPADCHFLGDPIDYIVFDGLSKKEMKQVVLLEIKAGKSKLTTRQRRIRDAVKDGKVKWGEYRVPKDL